MDGDAGLSFHHRKIPIDRAFEPGLVKHDGMERLRKTAYIFQCLLGNVANFVQFAADGGTFGRLLFGAAEQRADGDESLAEFVMKLPGNVAQGGLLSGDELAREFAALARKRCELLEKPAVRVNQ